VFFVWFWVQYVDTVHQSDKLIVWSHRWWCCAENIPKIGMINICLCRKIKKIKKVLKKGQNSPRLRRVKGLKTVGNQIVDWQWVQWVTRLYFSKYLLLCSTQQINSYRFGTTWGWVNNRIFWWNHFKLVFANRMV